MINEVYTDGCHSLNCLTLLHSDWPHLAILKAIGLITKKKKNKKNKKCMVIKSKIYIPDKRSTFSVPTLFYLPISFVCNSMSWIKKIEHLLHTI